MDVAATLAALEPKGILVLVAAAVVPTVFFSYLFASDAITRWRIKRNLRNRRSEEEVRNG